MNSIRWIHITDAICKSPMPWSYFWLIKKYSLFLWQLIKILLFKMKSFQNWIRIPQDFEEIRARGEAFALVSLCVPFYHKKIQKVWKIATFLLLFEIYKHWDSPTQALFPVQRSSEQKKDKYFKKKLWKLAILDENHLVYQWLVFLWVKLAKHISNS